MAFAQSIAPIPSIRSRLARQAYGRDCRRPRRQAFTLVELLVVIAILSVLAGLLLPALETAIGQARIAECQGNYRQVFLALNLYADDADDSWPVYNTYGNEGSNTYPYTFTFINLDPYLDYEGGLQYDNSGPLGENVYFCSETAERYDRGWQLSFGYAPNARYGRYFPSYNNAGGHRDEILEGKSRSSIKRPGYTFAFREYNVPDSHDYNMDGPGIWAFNPTNRNPGTYSGKFPVIHLGGQNLLYFDGHATYSRFWNLPVGQICDGLNDENFWTGSHAWKYP